MNSITSAVNYFWQTSGFSNEHKETRERILLIERVALSAIGVVATYVFDVPGVVTVAAGYLLTAETTNVAFAFCCLGHAVHG